MCAVLAVALSEAPDAAMRRAGSWSWGGMHRLGGHRRSGSPSGLSLRQGLPDSLELALREVLTRNGTPAGPAPPRNVTRLAGRCRIDRSNLARQAQRYGVDLGIVCELSLLRWLWLRIVLEPEASVNHLGHMSGSSTVRGLRSWVQRAAGRPLGRLTTLEVGAVEERLRDGLKGVTEADS